MLFKLTLTGAERDYLIGAIERAVIDDAAQTNALQARSFLFPRKNEEAFDNARAMLHVGAGILGKLAPDNLEVMEDIGHAAGAAPSVTDTGIYSHADAEALARAVPEFDRRALAPRCAHGVSFAEPCELCAGDNGGEVRTMPIQT